MIKCDIYSANDFVIVFHVCKVAASKDSINLLEVTGFHVLSHTQIFWREENKLM